MPSSKGAWWFAPAAKVEARPQRLLNLFAYTGGAALLAAKAGAEVTHLDASKRAVGWANQTGANLIVNGQVVRSATGNNSPGLDWASWNVSR